MQYFGGKERISKQLCEYLNSQLKEGQAFYDLFAGSCNVVSKIESDKRYANDIRQFMMVTMKAAADGYEFPEFVSEQEYQEAKNLPETDPLHGFILVGCSFAGKYKGGYARSKRRTSYAKSAKNSIERKAKLLKNVVWSHGSYDQVDIEPGSLVYCDIPYHNTTGYGFKFDHDKFYDWVSKQESDIYISEYEDSYNPLDLPTVWTKKSRQAIRNKDSKCGKTVEILRKFTTCDQDHSNPQKDSL